MCAQVGASRQCRTSLMSTTHTGIDLLIADVPEDLPVPVVSSSAIPDWNRRSKDYFKVLFTFAATHLHDDAVLLIIHSNNPAINHALRNWSFTLVFELVQDWWGLNGLHLVSPADPQKTVWLLSIPHLVSPSCVLINYRIVLLYLTCPLCRLCAFLSRSTPVRALDSLSTIARLGLTWGSRLRGTACYRTLRMRRTN